MKFPDFDLNAISNLLNSMSEEEKQQMSDMAADMLKNMNQNAAAAPQEEAEEEVDFLDALHLDSSWADRLDPKVLSALEAAWDLEDFYDGEAADYAASILFLQKALLLQCRSVLYPAAQKLLPEHALLQHPVQASSLYSFLALVQDPTFQQALEQKELLPADQLQELSMVLMQSAMALGKAEADAIDLDFLESFKRANITDETFALFDVLANRLQALES